MNTISQIQQHKIVAIIRGANPEDVVKIANALYDGGIRVLEITLNSNDALSVIRQLSGTMENKLLVGAGTVLDADSAKAAVDAGAKFIISPSLDTATIEATKERNMVSIPGAFTATEILAAYTAGGDIIKVFPASVGAGYIRDLRGPFPHIPLMPTGGVNLETIKEYMQAGAVAVGIGSALVDTKQKITDEYLQQLTTKAVQFMKRLAIFLLPVSLLVLTGCVTAKAKRSIHPPVAGSTWNLPLSANASLPMQWVPSGTFTMGSPVSEAGAVTPITNALPTAPVIRNQKRASTGDSE